MMVKKRTRRVTEKFPLSFYLFDIVIRGDWL